MNSFVRDLCWRELRRRILHHPLLKSGPDMYSWIETCRWWTLQVTGLGPTFMLSMHVQNTSMTQPSVDLCITFDYDFRLYSVRQPLIQVCSHRASEAGGLSGNLKA